MQAMCKILSIYWSWYYYSSYIISHYFSLGNVIWPCDQNELLPSSIAQIVAYWYSNTVLMFIVDEIYGADIVVY